MKYMLLIIGNQDAEPPTAESGQGLMEAFMVYHQSVVEAGVMVDSNVLDSFETATSVQVASSGDVSSPMVLLLRPGSISAATTSSTSQTSTLPLTGLTAAPVPGTGGLRFARSRTSTLRDWRGGRRLRRGCVPRGARPAAGDARAPVR